MAFYHQINWIFHFQSIFFIKFDESINCTYYTCKSTRLLNFRFLILLKSKSLNAWTLIWTVLSSIYTDSSQTIIGICMWIKLNRKLFYWIIIWVKWKQKHDEFIHWYQNRIHILHEIFIIISTGYYVNTGYWANVVFPFSRNSHNLSVV